jgi:hypothetical protein
MALLIRLFSTCDQKGHLLIILDVENDILFLGLEAKGLIKALRQLPQVEVNGGKLDLAGV